MDLTTITYGAGTAGLYSELVVDFAFADGTTADAHEVIDAVIAFNHADAVRNYGYAGVGHSLAVDVADGGVITEKGPGWVRLPEQMRTDLLAAAQRAYDSNSIVD